jgi:hypothetical protein
VLFLEEKKNQTLTKYETPISLEPILIKENIIINPQMNIEDHPKARSFERKILNCFQMNVI